jgi:predicted nucleic acid-binding protein
LGVDRLRNAIGRHSHVALDTSIFIYHLEANPTYVLLSDCIFSWLESETSKAVTSVITLTELLAKPYRESDADTATKCYALLSSYPNLEWISPTLETANLAAKIRATHRLRTPDALQAATAIEARATAVVSNDPIFRRVPHFDTLVLDDYL